MKTKLFSKKTNLLIVLYKTYLKNNLLILLIAFSLTNTTQANNSIITNYNFDTENDEWVLLKETSGVKVYYKISNCEDQNNLVNPLDFDPNTMVHHQTFQLKFINENLSIKSISFSKITTNDGYDEMETISIIPGTTILDSCESAAKLILTKELGDKYPISITDYLLDFKLTTNN
jgi:hypothetical protein